ncbi:MAG: TetR/AcrR family transcriptional regulator [Actinobacteria bacterium]|nr:TetR/AcrR family transcriptional regulator [Actinomycetota bacterium]
MTDNAALEEVDDPRASDGRRPGRRGLATRTRLLGCTAALLERMSYRELKVIDIAREAKTSPATFYQYFPDIESAILALAEATNLDTSPLGEVVRGQSWKGKAGYSVALELVDALLEFWESHRSVLRVVDLLVAEGNLRFQGIRSRMLNDLTLAMADVIADAEGTGRGRSSTQKRMATAGVLVAMLANVTAHRFTFEFWGIPTADLRRSMADVLYTSLTGKAAPRP